MPSEESEYLEKIVPNPQKSPLRCGFSTGACASAVAKLAWMRLTNAKTPEIAPFPDSTLSVRFPDGKDRQMPILAPSNSADAYAISENAYHRHSLDKNSTQSDGLENILASHQAAIRKDAGDDPDCTNGIILYADIRSADVSELRSEDYLLSVGEGKVILRAVEGIGLCTRSGLDCDQGRWAINPVPRQMITENLRLAGLVRGCWLLEIGIPNGAEIAKHTLNAQLGVLGGLSILGTTGIVHPYSNEAWIETIRLCVRSLAYKHIPVVFCTGNRTLTGAMKHLPHLPKEHFLFMGDFLAESLNIALQYGIQDIAIACMPGKLCKYALGFGNTHAAFAKQDLRPLLEIVRLLFSKQSPDLPSTIFPNTPALPSTLASRSDLPLPSVPTPSLPLTSVSVHSLPLTSSSLSTLIAQVAECSSVREALLCLPEEVRFHVLRELAEKSLKNIADHYGFSRLFLLVFDFNGDFLLKISHTQKGECHARSNASIDRI